EIFGEHELKEYGDTEKVEQMQQEALSKVERELDSLTRMRYRELIDDTAFIKERDVLRNSITKMKHQLTEPQDGRLWNELTEKTFHFVLRAPEKFKNGTITEKREILSGIGSNCKIQDKKLLIEASEWLPPIEKAYPELK